MVMDIGIAPRVLVFAIAVVLGLILVLSYYISPAPADWNHVAELWKGYEITPAEKDSIRNAKLPGSGVNCCGTADGIPVEWDIKDGHYWANWDGAWRQIDDEKVLKNLNLSFPVLWVTGGNKMLRHEDGTFEDLHYRDVRCFWPGAGG
jgi:hypothetical protein